MVRPWIETIDADQAASLANFTVLMPSVPEAAVDRRALSFRREGPPLPCHPAPERTIWSNWTLTHCASVTFVIRIGDAAIRCKQFLYDLGPLSAMDHAALYDHRPDAMTVAPLDDRGVAWIGYDYARARTLSCLRWGTTVELRLLRGPVDDGRLLRLAASLEPVATPPDTPFAVRTYWARVPRYDRHLPRGQVYRPPSSLWRFRWPWLALDHEWSSTVPETVFGGDLAALFAPVWRFDGACRFGATPDWPEIQARFVPGAGTGHAVLWVRRFRPDPASIPPPAAGRGPALDRYSGFDGFAVRRTVCAGIPCHTASRTEDHGPHDTVFWHGGWGYLVQHTASVDGTLAAHLADVGRLTRALA